MKYLWAAYKQGAFEEAGQFEEDLEPMDFAMAFISLANNLIEAGTSLIIVTADTPKGNMPVALITVEANTRIAWPHVFWFPSASSRNKVEIGVKFLRDIKKSHLALITARPEEQTYFRHLAKYGLLRQVGKIRDYDAPGNDVFLFQPMGS